MDPEQEKNLIERAKQCSEAFGELYDMYYSQIYGYALRRTANIDTAKDITSAVFLKALKNIRKFTWQGVPFSHWLYRIANREVLDRYKKNRHEAVYDVLEHLTETALREGLTEDRENTRKYDDFLDIHRYVSKLPVRYQEVVALRYFEDKSLAEIAVIIGKPEGTVKSILHRGIGKLRTMMDSGESL